jgi:hypothetical protein
MSNGNEMLSNCQFKLTKVGKRLPAFLLLEVMSILFLITLFIMAMMGFVRMVGDRHRHLTERLKALAHVQLLREKDGLISSSLTEYHHYANTSVVRRVEPLVCPHPLLAVGVKQCRLVTLEYTDNQGKKCSTMTVVMIYEKKH